MNTETLDPRLKFPKLKKQIEPEKKQASSSDLKNRNKSKLSCLIRKKYTKLMKDSIQTQKANDSIVCCRVCRSLSNKLILKLTSSIFQAFISLLAVLLYVAETYLPNSNDPDLLKDANMTLEYYTVIRSFYDNMEIIIAVIVA